MRRNPIYLFLIPLGLMAFIIGTIGPLTAGASLGVGASIGLLVTAVMVVMCMRQVDSQDLSTVSATQMHRSLALVSVMGLVMIGVAAGVGLIIRAVS